MNKMSKYQAKMKIKKIEMKPVDDWQPICHIADFEKKGLKIMVTIFTPTVPMYVGFPTVEQAGQFISDMLEKHPYLKMEIGECKDYV